VLHLCGGTTVRKKVLFRRYLLLSAA